MPDKCILIFQAAFGWKNESMPKKYFHSTKRSKLDFGKKIFNVSTPEPSSTVTSPTPAVTPTFDTPWQTNSYETPAQSTSHFRKPSKLSKKGFRLCSQDISQHVTSENGKKISGN